jgi:hypothetical protein
MKYLSALILVSLFNLNLYAQQKLISFDSDSINYIAYDLILDDTLNKVIFQSYDGHYSTELFPKSGTYIFPTDFVSQYSSLVEEMALKSYKNPITELAIPPNSFKIYSGIPDFILYEFSPPDSFSVLEISKLMSELGLDGIDTNRLSWYDIGKLVARVQYANFFGFQFEELPNRKMTVDDTTGYGKNQAWKSKSFWIETLFIANSAKYTLENYADENCEVLYLDMSDALSQLSQYPVSRNIFMHFYLGFWLESQFITSKLHKFSTSSNSFNAMLKMKQDIKTWIEISEKCLTPNFKQDFDKIISLFEGK